MTPFERYLYDNGLFDDVIRPEITAEGVVLEPADLCTDIGCEHCIGHWKRDRRVSYCTHECHKNFKATDVPYNHCSFLLGHVSVQTTERYIGCKQRLKVAVNDRLGIEPSELFGPQLGA